MNIVTNAPQLWQKYLEIMKCNHIFFEKGVPLIEELDEAGNFKYERPLFWAAYNQLRPVLAKERVFNSQNDAAHTSWEDLMEMRYFASTIIKASNVHDRKIEDYLTGVDALLEAEKIKQEIFNFEHDLWSY